MKLQSQREHQKPYHINEHKIEKLKVVFDKTVSFWLLVPDSRHKHPNNNN